MLPHADVRNENVNVVDRENENSYKRNKNVIILSVKKSEN